MTQLQTKSHARTIRVLILEDREPDALLVLKELERAGFNPVWKRVDNAADFSASLDSSLDIVLADYRLPGFNALEALKIRKEHGVDVPIIIITGSLGDELAAECIKQGAIDYMLKDRLARLGQAVTRALDERRLRQERERAEKELYNAHTQVRELLEHSPAVIYALKIEGENIVPHLVSENVSALLGFAQPEFLQPNWLFDHIHPEDLASARGHLMTVMAEGHGTIDFRVRHKNGTYRWFEDKKRLIRDASGQAREIVGVLADITERKRAEEVLAGASSVEESRRRRKIVLELITVFGLAALVFASDIAWSWSEQLLRSVLRSRLTLVDESLGALSVLIIGLLVFSYRRWKESKAEAVAHRHVGEAIGKLHREMEKRVNLRTTELVKANQALRTEVDERKRAEMRTSAFSALGRKLSSAKTAQEAGQIILETADQLFGWDCCALDLYSADENAISHVLNKDTVDGRRKDCPPTANNTTPSQLARRAIESGPQLILKEPPFTFLTEGLPIGDTSRPSASIMLVPIRDGSKVIGLLSIQSYTPSAYTPEDLNTLQSLADHCGGSLHRIRGEDERRQLEQQFRQSQKMEAIGQLAGGVAHDFNNLLTVITGYSDFLLMDEKPDTLVGQQLKEISAAAKRASSLTRQLLTFSRKQVIKLQPVNLNSVISDLTKMLTRMIGEDVTLENIFAPQLPPILADTGMIEQVLMNLAVNARDAMPNGGKLIIKTEALTISHDHAQPHPEGRPGDFVCLSVGDTGCGMSAETMARIFEPFFTTKAPGKGTGLGLATVYGIVKQHQGWLEVTSEVGLGTTFKLFFPLSQTAIPDERKTLEPDIRGGHETILLVEDEVAVRSLARHVLRDYGYQIVEAASGVEALKLWEECGAKVDLLVTDLVMPDGVNGKQLAWQLQAKRPDLKVLYTSGYSHNVTGTELELREGRNFLPKPYTPRRLAELVRQRLDGK